MDKKQQLKALKEISPEAFERFAWKRFTTIYPQATVYLYGRSGQADYGVDILVVPASDDQITAIQCKRWMKVSKQELDKAANHFLKNTDKWKRHGVREYILLTTAEVTSPTIIDHWILLKKKFTNAGFRSQLRGSDYLEEAFIDNETFERPEPTRQIQNWNIYINEIQDAIAGCDDNTLAIYLQYRLMELGEPRSERDALMVCIGIMDDDRMLSDWKIRRAIAYTAARNIANKSELAAFFLDYLIERISDSEYCKLIFLQIFSENSQIVEMSEQKTIVSLIENGDAMVIWQALKATNAGNLGTDTYLQLLTENSVVDWLKRPIFYRLCQLFDHNIKLANKTYQNHYLGSEILPQLWVVAHGITIGSPISDTQYSDEARIACVILENRIPHQFQVSASTLSQAFVIVESVLFCNSIAGIRVAASTSSEGFYGVLRERLTTVLNSISDKERKTVFAIEISTIAEEGVSWALATIIPLLPLEAVNQVVTNLLSKSHPWVIRELLNQLAISPNLIESIHPENPLWMLESKVFSNFFPKSCTIEVRQSYYAISRWIPTTHSKVTSPL